MQPEPAPGPLPPPARVPRLDPFVFPRDTDFRFALLIISVLASGLLIYHHIHNSLVVDWDEAERAEAAAEVAALRAHPGSSTGAVWRRQQEVNRRMSPLYRRQAMWMLGGTGLVVVLATVLYWTAPRRVIRRRKLVPLTDEDDPEVLHELRRLIADVDLPSEPVFLWSPLRRTQGGLAFGRIGRRYVGLDGGLVMLYHLRVEAFRAIVLHEIAHLQNNDVDKAYYAVAVWQAFVAAALLPFAVSLAGRSAFRDMLDYGWRAAGLSVLVLLMRNAVLRAREVYADLRASVYEKQPGALREVLASMRQKPAGWFGSVLSVHPPGADRARTLVDTRRVLRMGLADGMLTGAAAAVAYPNVQFLFGSVWPLLPPLAGHLAASLLLASLAAGAAGVGGWRNAMVAMNDGRRPDAALTAGAAIAAGFWLGQEMSLITVGLNRAEGALTGASRILFYAVWYGALAISLGAFSAWCGKCALAWLPVARSKAEARRYVSVGVVAGAALLVPWLAVMFYVYAFRSAGAGAWEEIRNAFAVEAGVGLSPLMLPLVTVLLGLTMILKAPAAAIWTFVLWAFPLAAALKRAHPGAASPWAYLDGDSLPLSPGLPHAPLRPALAAAAGIGASLLFLAVSIVIMTVLHQAGGLAEWVAYGHVLLALAFQAASAVIVTLIVRSLPVIHALCAAWTGGVVMSFGTLLVAMAMLGGLPGGETLGLLVWQSVGLTVNGGCLAAAVTALPAAAALASLRRLRARPVTAALRGGERPAS